MSAEVSCEPFWLLLIQAIGFLTSRFEGTTEMWVLFVKLLSPAPWWLEPKHQEDRKVVNYRATQDARTKAT